MFVLVCPLDMSEWMNESMSVKGWLEDHDFALGKGHGKKKAALTEALNRAAGRHKCEVK